MNWTALIYFGMMLMSLMWYAVAARKWYTGPRTLVATSGPGGGSVAGQDSDN